MVNKIMLTVNANKIILSSKTVIYKTENFIKQTKNFSLIDNFVSKIAETIIKDCLKENDFYFNKNENDAFLIAINNFNFQFIFKFGYQLKDVNKTDVIFCDVVKLDDNVKQNDQRIVNFLKDNKSFNIEIVLIKKIFLSEEFNKLYLVSNTSEINLPKLDGDQKQIIETVNKNMLVEGVAGSGKTNVCIDKIIFSACKNYSLKILYTTFSRGLLNDTKLKIVSFTKELENFVSLYEKGNVEFLDENHKKALENKFGIYFFSEDDDKILQKIKNIIYYLNNKVDYFLIQDLFKNNYKNECVIANEQYFINEYSKNNKNHQIQNTILKLKKYSLEIIYKEIFGILGGFCNINNPLEKIDLQTYASLRKDSFSFKDCESIYMIAKDYYNHLKNNNLCDNNTLSRKMLENVESISQYALSIIDEVQDYTQITLYFLNKISLKMFCVGDALQMINPSYFSFSYLKNILFNEDVSGVMELKNNYRNTKKIAELLNDLSNINKLTFGTHSFVLNNESVDNGIKTSAIYCNDKQFIDLIQKNSFDNFTIVVSSLNEKEKLKKIIKNQEILTVSEIKGLERPTIVAYNLLTENLDKWNYLKNITVNRKLADENSVYRYYYNLFYVGISRAKQNLFVLENEKISQFENFFKNNFILCSANESIKELNKIVSKIEFTDDEIIARINEFIKLEQYDNAKFIANKIQDDILQKKNFDIIEINKNYIQYGKYREAGIKFWEKGYLIEAKKQFEISGDETLSNLIDACTSNDSTKLNADIIKYYYDVNDNPIASGFIIETMKNDLNNLKQQLKETKQKLKGKEYGKK